MQELWKDLRKYRAAYLIGLPVLIWYFVFHYIPMYGAIIAFKRFAPAVGIWGSEWVGLANFKTFFQSYYFLRILKNTLILNLMGLIFSFPAPIIFALLLNEVKNRTFKRTVQTITYIPHFISIIVICGMIIDFVGSDGIISVFIANLTGTRPENLLLNSANFRLIFVASEVWQQVGWNSIIYLAAISGIDTQLYEAAEIDGANRLRQVFSVTLPGIMPTLMVLLIMRLGAIMNVGFEKVMLLYNPSIYEVADVISTFTYRSGILEANYSHAAAVGLFNSAINCIMVISANQISKKLTEQSLW